MLIQNSPLKLRFTPRTDVPSYILLSTLPDLLVKLQWNCTMMHLVTTLKHWEHPQTLHEFKLCKRFFGLTLISNDHTNKWQIFSHFMIERERLLGIYLGERPIHSIESVCEVNELTTCRSHMKIDYKPAW